MRTCRLAAAFAAFLAATGSARGDCPQDLAIYEDPDGLAGIVFTGPAGPVDAMEYRFLIPFVENAVQMEGVVMRLEDPAEPWGLVMHDCPEGDVTGAEIDACTVWEGVVYSTDGSGVRGYLAEADREAGIVPDAGRTLLLPGFGQAVKLSAAWGPGGLGRVPGDVFHLKACQQ